MVSHALKMLVLFIFVVATINLLYYASYWSYDPTLRRIRPSKRHVVVIKRDHNNKGLSVKKVMYLPGSKRNTRVKRVLEMIWKPKYSCPESSTKPDSTTTSKVTDYRDPEDSSEMDRGSLCPPVPPALGPIHWRNVVDAMIMEKVFSMLSDGGSYQPIECVPRHYVAIIVPFKGKNAQLLLFLLSLHLTLLQQQVEYQIFVVKQRDESRAMNTGKLLNIGFLEAHTARDDIDWTCVVFHDPDLAPTNSRNLYRCSQYPKQLVSKVGNTSYVNKFGGAIAIQPEDFRAVNGFSNMYYDNEYMYLDMYDRLIAANYTIEEPSKFAVYDDLRIILNEENSTNTTSANTVAPIIELTSTPMDWQNDGLSSVAYSYVVNTRVKMSHVLLKVDLSPQPSIQGHLRSVHIGVPDNPPTSSTFYTEFTTASTDAVKKTASPNTRRLKKSRR